MLPTAPYTPLGDNATTPCVSCLLEARATVYAAPSVETVNALHKPNPYDEMAVPSSTMSPRPCPVRSTSCCVQLAHKRPGRSVRLRGCHDEAVLEFISSRKSMTDAMRLDHFDANETPYLHERRFSSTNPGA
ncbi:hypothetical protein V7S43_010801 [Phytophthora oleae]|uniref:Uncharacterized protein n=1 Tax=Phytophthora oleae TaxID=2107226 RepID=A0ABD3FBW4_9STRA